MVDLTFRQLERITALPLGVELGSGRAAGEVITVLPLPLNTRNFSRGKKELDHPDRRLRNNPAGAASCLSGVTHALQVDVLLILAGHGVTLGLAGCWYGIRQEVLVGSCHGWRRRQAPLGSSPICGRLRHGRGGGDGGRGAVVSPWLWLGHES